ncbi:MAG: FtsX-like permease family protein, partial [Bacteroidales bacterium]|nr:FtsX-like permease family protein [Bacteroidales bacterium]
RTASRILAVLPYDLMLTTVTQAHPALFSWLDLLNANITLILAIMCLVSAVAIVSALLIMIFEKSATIGLLKALGACNQSVRRIFLIKSMRLILWGIALGDALALALSAAQQQWQMVQLDAESYSMSHVPVLIDPWVYVLVSAGTLAICLLALLLPVATVSRISPARTMRVEK